jgi:membrane protein involved in colicin uptake
MADQYYNMRYVASTSSSSSDKSYPGLIKKAMMKMPMSMNTKKSIDEYYKDAMKDVDYKMKTVEKAKKAAEKARLAAEKAAKKAAEKAAKPKVSKVTKKPTKRQLFFDKMRPRVNEMFPYITTSQATKKIADLWNREQGKDIYRI